MTGETPNIRHERIERLLTELKYEVTRGMMEREIDEEIGFTFIVPVSQRFPNGIVRCEFRATPLEHPGMAGPDCPQPRIRSVKPTRFTP